MTGRPEPLFPLFAGLETLDGVGPKTAKLMEQMGVETPIRGFLVDYFAVPEGEPVDTTDARCSISPRVEHTPSPPPHTSPRSGRTRLCPWRCAVVHYRGCIPERMACQRRNLIKAAGR